MSQATSNISGPTGASFTIIISAGRIELASLHVVNQEVKTLEVGASFQQVTVPSLPNGDSLVQLVMQLWRPGEPNAIVDVGPGTPATVTAPDPKARIDDGSMFGFVKLFGT
jgi:hypothetical protein